MGISTQYWGRQGWQFIHYVALNYPHKPSKQDKETYQKFLDNIPEILPCPICGHHFKENMDKHPPNLNSRMDFFKWTVDMHNIVNEQNNKKKLSYEDALAELEKNPNYLKNALLFSFSITALVIISVKLISKYRK